MAMSVVYTTVNGQVLSENRGGVVHHFVPDPLGSVVMVRDTAGNTVYTAEYSPYGDVQSETGTNPSEFGYVGTLGYVKDSASSLYVRARYLLTNLGRWLTKDPLWPEEPGYVYAVANPASRKDASGMKPVSTVCPPPPRPGGPVACSPAWNQYIYAFCNCFRDLYSRECSVIASQYYARCGKPKPRGDFWDFAPPPGRVGDVTPRPVPPPNFWKPREICAPPKPPTPPITTSNCVSVGDKYNDPSPNAWLGKLGRCRSCCQERGLGKDCYDSCNVFLHGLPPAAKEYFL